MRFLVVVFSELCGVVESGMVKFERLEEPFDPALCASLGAAVVV